MAGRPWQSPPLRIHALFEVGPSLPGDLGFQWELLRFSSHGVPMRAVAPIRLAAYLAWCEKGGLDAESSSA